MDKNIIEYNDFSAGISVKLPAPHRTEVKGIVKPVTKLGKRLARHQEAAADLSKAMAAFTRTTQAIEDEAADAAKGDRPVEAKKLVKRQRAAEDAVEEARIDQTAAATAMRSAYSEVIEAVGHHRPALRAEAIANLDADMLALATVLSRLREIFENVDEHVGVLGMVDTFDTDTRPILRPTFAGGKVPFHVSVAIQELVGSIGAVSEVLDNARSTATAEPDVVVPMPEEETVDETPTVVDEFAIVATRDTGDDDE